MMDKPFSKILFSAACSGMFLFGVTLITLGSVAPALQEKFQLDGLASGTLFSLLPFGIVIGSLVFGPVADRYGYKAILILSSMLIFSGLLGIAYASSFSVLKISVFIFGFGGGAINGSTNALVSDISGENRSANLSLLGVFFALGALGMPLLLGALQKIAGTELILTATAVFTLVCAGLFAFVQFPLPKQRDGVSLNTMLSLPTQRAMWLIALFLSCQSGLEGIMNNWTTLYLTEDPAIQMRSALFALSLYVGGMAVMRLVLGWLLRQLATYIIMLLSMGLLFVGNVILVTASTYEVATAGLILIGVGLAAGFPVMLGLAGTKYAAISGTAFSLIISIALLGNMLINYATGVIVDAYGIKRMMVMPFLLNVTMVIFSILIFKNFRDHKQTTN